MISEKEMSVYLNRIGYEGDVSTDLKTLHQLHERHILSVPFEDIDIHSQTPIVLEIGSIYNKVVIDRRGGFCYELNFLFYTLLDRLGFNVKMISSRIHNQGGQLGPMFDHMSLVVQLEEVWLLDVGYGDLFVQPMCISKPSPGTDTPNNYKIEKESDSLFMLWKYGSDNKYVEKYQFDIRERSIDDFAQQCHYKQYTPGTYFVTNLICTILATNGRATVFNLKFTEVIDGIRTEHILENAAELCDILSGRFDIKIDKDTVEKIWSNHF